MRLGARDADAGHLVQAFSSHHPDMLPIPERDLFVQSVLIGDAGFAVVDLEVAAAAGSPSLLIGVVIPKAAKGRFGVGVVPLVVRLHLHMVVSVVEELDQAVYFVAGLFAEAPDGLKDLFGGDVSRDVQRRVPGFPRRLDVSIHGGGFLDGFLRPSPVSDRQPGVKNLLETGC